MKTNRNDNKGMSKASIHRMYLILIFIIVVLYTIRLTQYHNLIKFDDERCNEIELLEEQVDELQTENNIFTSMLSEIENEPGGHTILKKLWDKHQNTDE